MAAVQLVSLFAVTDIPETREQRKWSRRRNTRRPFAFDRGRNGARIVRPTPGACETTRKRGNQMNGSRYTGASSAWVRAFAICGAVAFVDDGRRWSSEGK